MPTPMIAILIVLGTGGTVVGSILRLHAERQERWRAWEAHFEIVPGRSGALPLVHEVDPYRIGVTPSKYVNPSYHPPYVARDLDAALDRALATAQFVLVVGDSKAGKSRTACEAALRVCPNHGLVVPRGEGGNLTRILGAGAAVDLGSSPAVLWLDDLDRYLGVAEGLDLAMLDRLACEKQQLKILATITSSRRSELLEAGSEIRRRARLVLDQAIEMRLETTLSEAERHEGRRLYPKEDLTHGIGEPLVAGRTLVRRYEDGIEVSPSGRGLVDAAIDWRLAGVMRAVTESELRGLYPFYLRRLRGDHDPTDEEFRAGLTWARQAVATHAALLAYADTPKRSYTVIDYVVEYAADRKRDRQEGVPRVTWDLILQTVEAEELDQVAFHAYLFGEHEVAATGWERVAQSSLDAAPSAALSLGILYKEQGNAEAAIRAYQQAIDSKNGDVAPRSAANLGALLGEQRDFQRAQDVLRWAISSGHPDAGPQASFNLGIVLEDAGSLDDAQSAYKQAIDSCHPEWTPVAAGNLGLLLHHRSDFEGAKRAFRLAIDLGHPDATPMAAVNLGLLLGEEDNVEGARLAFQQAIDSSHIDAAPAAAYNLGSLLQKHGDLEGAKLAFQCVIDSGHTREAPEAMLRLSIVLAEQDDLEGCKRVLQQAAECGHPNIAPAAILALGGILIASEDWNTARQIFQQAADSIDAGVAAAAQEQLSKLDSVIAEREAEIQSKMVEALEAAGIQPAHIYAYKRTGLLVAEGNEHLFTPEDLAEWDEAVEEFLAGDQETDIN